MQMETYQYVEVSCILVSIIIYNLDIREEYSELTTQSKFYYFAHFKASPCVRFNKDGTLLAVFAKENRIKILANDSSPKLQQASENTSFASSSLSEILSKVSI